MTEITKDRLASSVAWEFAEKFGTHLMAFVLSLLLARVLEPELHGIVSLTTVFFNLLLIFVDSGLATSLIQKKDADDVDFSTVFFTSVFLCVIGYGAFYLLTPAIARFYNEELLKPILRVTGLVLIPGGIKSVQRAYISKHFLFRRFFFASLPGTVIAAVVAYWMALNGYGAWSLVVLHLLDTGIDTLIIGLTIGWKPKMMFSFERLKNLAGYGTGVFLASFIGTFYIDLLALMIGKAYSADYLTVYSKGRKLPQVVSLNLLGAINSVLFPAMSSVNDDDNLLRKMMQKAIAVSNYVMWPLMAGLFVMADNVTVLLLTDTWISSALYLQVFALFYAFTSFGGGNTNALKAIGRSDLVFRNELWKNGLSLAIFIVSLFFGKKALPLSFIICIPAMLMAETRYSSKYFEYPLLSQLKDNLVYVIMAVVMAVPVYFLDTLSMPLLYKVVLQVLTGGIVYLIESVILRVEPFYFLLDYLKKAVGHAKND
ncbi:MAG: lipopolysaccharide biosynthesis protein [Erysipelotrichaceae bacterium]|nr:lipopolysaccharide biosynthesis protein [Erysipelotrichaceae bacterium]